MEVLPVLGLGVTVLGLFYAAHVARSVAKRSEAYGLSKYAHLIVDDIGCSCARYWVYGRQVDSAGAREWNEELLLKVASLRCALDILEESYGVKHDFLYKVRVAALLRHQDLSSLKKKEVAEKRREQQHVFSGSIKDLYRKIPD